MSERHTQRHRETQSEQTHNVLGAARVARLSACVMSERDVYDLPAAAMMTFPLAVVTCNIRDYGTNDSSRNKEYSDHSNLENPVLAAVTIQVGAIDCFLGHDSAL